MSLDHPRFGRVLTAMVTPFDEAGALDVDAAARLARWLVDHGSDGLVVAGTTGESPVLSDEERLDLIEAVAGAVDVPVIAGSTTNDTAHSVMLTRQAADRGADAILAVTPYYNRPSQAGLRAHFAACAEATDLPVVLYDIPARSGRKIAIETILALVGSHGNVVGVKDASGEVAGAAALVARAPAHFEVYSGDDALTLALMSVGAVGVISVASHWVGLEMRAALEAFAQGDVARAAALNGELAGHYAFESSERWPNPEPTKAVLRALGVEVGRCRLPMVPHDPELDAEAAALVDRLRAPRG
jgi:4-hydroxy-tetrahydrodipicolinate synthase